MQRVSFPVKPMCCASPSVTYTVRGFISVGIYGPFLTISWLTGNVQRVLIT